ncbi:sugar kinase [Arthrobacter sp. B3I4]|uniref:sugar kinase n=1 Tax=Arthrobacter sp. B3I4 TaxID=3042267 RepID=UPI0027863E17|nr:sugar kinase [Arthrobacter sp. B3I4]MDQ0754631.1 2-dehydro-3-deoxygluconokinase [Arthrobacter sp. B3I4]
MNAGPGGGTPSEVVTLGETMALMKAATPGPLAFTESLRLGIGGAESNVAIALRRLGTSVTWVGRVGNDSLGDLVLRELMAEGLDVDCSRDAGATTGLMIKERRTSETAKVWYYRSGSAGSKLSPQDLPEGKIAAARLLHITGITPALSASAAAAVQAAIDCAKTAGTLVSFDVNYRSALWTRQSAAVTFQTLARQADVVFAGDDEAAIFVGNASDPLELAHRVAQLGPGQVVVKLGERGCVALVDGQEYRQDAVPVRVLDTVGAGDAFVGGYLAELLDGQPVQQRLLTAVRTGAYACMVPGDWEGMPRRSELGLLDLVDPVHR